VEKCFAGMRIKIFWGFDRSCNDRMFRGQQSLSDAAVLVDQNVEAGLIRPRGSPSLLSYVS
jgi:hypothetical protein